MPPIRFRIRTIMITIAVSAAVMGGVRGYLSARNLGRVDRWRRHGACVERERISAANDTGGSLHIIQLRTVTRLPLKPFSRL